jgi:pyruvate,water dikinase
MGNEVKTANDRKLEHQRCGRFVLALREIDKWHASESGGKAANVARMFQAGLQVPDGFCITTAAFRQFMGRVDGIDAFYASLETLTSQNIEQVQSAAERLRQRLETVPVPEEVKAEILHAWRAQDLSQGYAVRSSATAEDLPHASFAGQHDTFLNVLTEDALLEAVRACRGSVYRRPSNWGQTSRHH